MTFSTHYTAIIHYKSAFQHTAVRYSTSGGTNNSWVTHAFDSHSSPIHPSFVVIRLAFGAHGLHFLPVSGTAGIRLPDGGPAPRFANQEWAHGNHYIVTRPGTYVLANGKLTRFSDDVSTVRDQFNADLPPASVRRARLSIFLDIDGTLFGGGRMGAFVRLWERKLALRGAVVVLNTGRSSPSVLDFLAQTRGAIVPTAAICRVGCEVRWFRDSYGWRKRDHFHTVPVSVRDEAWAARLAGAGGWEWRRVLMRVREPLERNPRVRGKLSEPVTRECPPPPYMTFVLTFTVKRAHASEAMRVVRSALGDIGVKLSICGDGVDYQHLDIINCRAGKLGGLRYVLEVLGPQFTAELAVMAGDSGNDLDAIDHDGVEKAIIVGNAEEELQQYWNELQRRKPRQTRVVRAKKCNAEGIVEGLALLNLV